MVINLINIVLFSKRIRLPSKLRSIINLMRFSHFVYVAIGLLLGLVVSGKTPLISVVVRINSRDSHYQLLTKPTHLPTLGYTTDSASLTRSATAVDDT